MKKIESRGLTPIRVAILAGMEGKHLGYLEKAHDLTW